MKKALSLVQNLNANKYDNFQFFFKIPKNSVIILSKDYACKKLEKMVETGRHSRSKCVFKKWGLFWAIIEAQKNNFFLNLIFVPYNTAI